MFIVIFVAKDYGVVCIFLREILAYHGNVAMFDASEQIEQTRPSVGLEPCLLNILYGHRL
jgi:hypothetical protein